MIIPGLLTASTSKADHLGMSTDRVACLSMIGAPFAVVVLVFGIENAFSPSVVESKHGWALSVAPGRSQRSGEPQWSLRNGGCGDGLPCEDENGGGGKLNKKFFFSAGMEHSGMKARP